MEIYIKKESKKVRILQSEIFYHIMVSEIFFIQIDFDLILKIKKKFSWPRLYIVTVWKGNTNGRSVDPDPCI